MKVEIDLEFRAASASIEAINHKEVLVSVDKVHKCDVLEQFTLEEIVYCFGEDKIMDHIGKERVMEHFGLKD